MKIVHLSDLHLGKRVNEFSMIEDQKHILSNIINIIKNEKTDAVVIAGDIYDKTVPPVEAICIFDSFLTKLMELKVSVFVISGNHDSAGRLSFGNKIMASSNIFVSSAYNGVVTPVTVNDEFGPVNFYLIPFIKPALVKPFFENEKIENYTDAMSVIIKNMNINKSERNVLVAHQFVTGASRCESEEISVGGLDNIDASVFRDFDYVALGHIHGPQNIGSEKICYSGTPLKYSFSECNHKKSVKIVELLQKINGETNSVYRTVPLVPFRDMREIRGTYDELMSKNNYENTNLEDYIHITLTDENDIINGFSRLQSVYKNLMKLDYDNKRTSFENKIEAIDNSSDLGPDDIFKEFFKLQNNQNMTDEQCSFISGLIESIWEDNE